jgi:hypothetical protein
MSHVKLPVVLLTVVFSFLFALGSAGAGPVTVAPLKLITGPSPFAGCTVGATSLPGETLYFRTGE